MTESIPFHNKPQDTNQLELNNRIISSAGCAAIGSRVGGDYYVGAKIFPDGTLDLRKAALWLGPVIEMTPKSLHEQFNDALEEIKSFPFPKAPLTYEEVGSLKPYSHYTSPGNILQILRFGIQSGNFKNRINENRINDPLLDDIASKMSGFRYQQGASYQGKDSICLSEYDGKFRHHLMFLVDPDIKVFGGNPNERDKTVGYSSGAIIVDEAKKEGFDIGNSAGYGRERLAANIVPPSAIKGVIIGPYASLLNGLQEVTGNNVLAYEQARLKDPAHAKEDLLANSKLIAELSNDAGAEAMLKDFSEQIDGMPYKELRVAMSKLQNSLLGLLVGMNNPLNEKTLRNVIEEKFGFKFIYADNKQ